MDAAGNLVFTATLRFPADPPSAFHRDIGIVFRGSAQGVSAITDPSTEHAEAFPEVNGAGQVSFATYALDTADLAVWRWTGGARVRIADASLFDGLTGLTAIDSAGRVVFTSRGVARNGVYRGDGSETAAEDYSVIFEDTSEPTPFVSSWSFARGGDAVAYAWRDLTADPEFWPIGRTRLFLGDGSSTTLVAESGMIPVDQPAPLVDPSSHTFAIDDAGRVAFRSGLQNGLGAGVYLWDAGSIRTLVQTLPPEYLPTDIMALNNAHQSRCGSCSPDGAPRSTAPTPSRPFPA